jgi:hypothetical protein
MKQNSFCAVSVAERFIPLRNEIPSFRVRVSVYCNYKVHCLTAGFDELLSLELFKHYKNTTVVRAKFYIEATDRSPMD